MSLRTILVALCVIVFIFALATANFAEEKKEHQFTGVTGCKGCHSIETVGGTQYIIWKDDPHAGAYASLATDKSKEIATKAGIEGDPQKSDKCLKCHVTAFGVKAELLAKTYKQEDGVGCESCHGAGKDFMPMDVMQNHDAAVAAGLAKIDEKTCTACHNSESPTYKEFKYEEFLKEIKHWKDEAAAKS
jgi:nitrate/TMAO reductase-like tetraheme cytochrome c subunit